MVKGAVIWVDDDLGPWLTKLKCRDYKSVDNSQIGLSSVVVGEMTDICEAAPGAVSPCGGENMIDWIDLW